MRLGHVREKGLQEMYKQELLFGYQIERLDLCEHCVLGKATRISFAASKHSTTKPFMCTLIFGDPLEIQIVEEVDIFYQL